MPAVKPELDNLRYVEPRISTASKLRLAAHTPHTLESTMVGPERLFRSPSAAPTLRRDLVKQRPKRGELHPVATFDHS